MAPSLAKLPLLLTLSLGAGAAWAQGDQAPADTTTAPAGTTQATTPTSAAAATDPLRTLVAVQSAELDTLRDTVAQMKADLARVSAACAAGTPTSVATASGATGNFLTVDEFTSYKSTKGCMLRRYLQGSPPSCPSGYQVVAVLRNVSTGYGDDGSTLSSGPSDHTLCCR